MYCKGSDASASGRSVAVGGGEGGSASGRSVAVGGNRHSGGVCSVESCRWRCERPPPADTEDEVGEEEGEEVDRTVNSGTSRR